MRRSHSFSPWPFSGETQAVSRAPAVAFAALCLGALLGVSPAQAGPNSAAAARAAVNSGGNPGAAAGVPGEATAEQLQRELESLQAQERQVAEALNRVNPLAQATGEAPGGAQLVMPPGMENMAPMIARLQAIAANPYVQKASKLARDPAFMKSAEQMAKNPDRYKLLYAELGWFAFMLFFRAWLFSRVDGFAKRMGARLFSFVLYTGVASFALPYFLIGAQYFDMMTMIYATFAGPA